MENSLYCCNYATFNKKSTKVKIDKFLLKFWIENAINPTKLTKFKGLK